MCVFCVCQLCVCLCVSVYLCCVLNTTHVTICYRLANETRSSLRRDISSSSVPRSHPQWLSTHLQANVIVQQIPEKLLLPTPFSSHNQYHCFQQITACLLGPSAKILSKSCLCELFHLFSSRHFPFTLHPRMRPKGQSPYPQHPAVLQEAKVVLRQI